MGHVAPGGDARKATLQNAAAATDTGEELDITVAGGGGAFSAVCFQVSGTFTATVTFQCTVDGTNWVSLLVEDVATGSTGTTTTAAGVFRVTVLGFLKVRANVTAYTNGSVTVVGLAVA